MKYMNIVSAITLVMVLSGCGPTVRGPSGVKFDLQTVCNTSAKSNCSPTVGSKLALLEQQIPLKLHMDKKVLRPQLSAYLGTITQRDVDLFGEPGAYCGVGKVEGNPFKKEDFTNRPVYTNHATIAETFGNYSSVAIEADIKEALRLAGVAKPVLDKLESAIETESKYQSEGASFSKVRFVEYRIEEEALRQLEAAKSGESTNKDITRFKNCIDTLLIKEGKKTKWRLYQSITGFIVDENTATFGSNSSFSGKFRAALKSKIESSMQNATQSDTIAAVPTVITNPVPKDSVGSAQTEVVEASKPIAEVETKSVPQNNFAVTNSLSDNDCNITPPVAGTENDNIAKIEATYKSFRCARTTGKSDPYFVVLGVSFWQSPRYPEIN